MNSSLSFLQKILNNYDIQTTTEQRITLLKHIELVQEVNQHLNLTKIIDTKDAIYKHLLDSLLGYKILSQEYQTKNNTFLDIGTGAGFPGIPFGVLSGLRGTLIDSIGKKIKTVNHFIKSLNLLNLEASHIRAEELALQKKRYSIILMRAVDKTDVLLEYATPLLKENGLTIIYKSKPEKQELLNANKTAALCGLTNVSRETFTLPEDYGIRTLLIYKKTGVPKLSLPRKNGMAKNKPLSQI